MGVNPAGSPDPFLWVRRNAVGFMGFGHGYIANRTGGACGNGKAGRLYDRRAC